MLGGPKILSRLRDVALLHWSNSSTSPSYGKTQTQAGNRQSKHKRTGEPGVFSGEQGSNQASDGPYWDCTSDAIDLSTSDNHSPVGVRFLLQPTIAPLWRHLHT